MNIPHPGFVAPLEVVDLETDNRVFAIIVDRCKHSCHSQKWAINARRNFKAVGVDLGDIEKSRGGSYTKAWEGRL